MKNYFSETYSAETITGAALVLPLRVNDLRTGWQSKPVCDLIMIKGVRGYSWLYWNDGSKQMMAYTIKHYANQLPMNDFIRVHQNCIINRNFVQKPNSRTVARSCVWLQAPKS